MATDVSPLDWSEWQRTDVDLKLPEGEIVAIELAGESLGLLRRGDRWYAFADRCTHAGCSFSGEGEVVDMSLVCLCHGSEFNLATGEVTLDPATVPLRTFETEVRDGSVWIRAAHKPAPVTGGGDGNIVIVGGGIAGLEAARAVRAGGFQGRLTVVAAETRLPYRRTDLSKRVLRDGSGPDELATDAEDLEIEWLLGTRAVGLRPDQQRVVLSTGRDLSYRAAILATGSGSRVPQAFSRQEGFLVLRSVDEAEALRSRFEDGDRILVIGAGVLGCEIASAARSNELEVTICDVLGAPMANFGEPVAEYLTRLHRRNGVGLRMNSLVTSLRRSGSHWQVDFDDGESKEIECVVVAAGAVPAVDWLADSGLVVDDGVEVDATLTARGADDVLVAGDLARHPHPLRPGETIRVEHWDNALAQGRLAGEGALLPPDERSAFVAIPSFWSDQFDVSIQVVGFPTEADVWRQLEGDAEQFTFAAERDGRMVAAVSNIKGRSMRAEAELIEARLSLGRDWSH
jgi:3-phenylpropionate/trans-cinnamate dioxygenase ferredoxin reductase subunit